MTYPTGDQAGAPLAALWGLLEADAAKARRTGRRARRVTTRVRRRPIAPITPWRGRQA